MVTLYTNRTERLEIGAVLCADHGELTVAGARPFQQRWIVQFTEVQDRDAAESLRGQALRAEPIVDPDELWVHELIGMRVCETDGTERGRVEAVQAIRLATCWFWNPGLGAPHLLGGADRRPIDGGCAKRPLRRRMTAL